MSKKDNQTLLMKLGFFGCQSVGKTCLISKYAKNKFIEKHIVSTPDLTEKTVERGNKTIYLKILDTAGQEKYNSITKQYFQGLHGLFLVYDLTDQFSFDKLNQWLSNAKQSIDKKTPIILIGNKTDLKNRVISYDEGNNYASTKEELFTFIETSAKNNENVEEAFNTLIDKCIELEKYDKVSDDEEEDYLRQKEKKKKNCC